jgi:ribosomal protein L12E/L44/L45/RPP1/RPP2
VIPRLVVRCSGANYKKRRKKEKKKEKKKKENERKTKERKDEGMNST